MIATIIIKDEENNLKYLINLMETTNALTISSYDNSIR